VIEKRRKMISSIILKDFAALIAEKLTDPDLEDCTITQVDLSVDAKTATVFFHSKDFAICLAGLNRSRKKLRMIMANSLQTRALPELVFKADKGWENANRVEQLLKMIEEKKAPTE
jgi:ribosome-binding factor A